MDYKEYFQKLESFESFEAQELSFEEFWELFNHSNFKSFKNWSQFLSFYQKELKFEHYQILEEKIKTFPEIEDLIISSLDIPNKGVFKVDLNSLTLENQMGNLSLKEETISSLKKINIHNLELSLERKKGSFTYHEPSSTLNQLSSQSKKIVNLALSLMMVTSLNTSTFAKDFNKDLKPSKISHQLSGSAILKNVDDVVEDLSKSDHPVVKQALSSIDSITADDLKLVTKFEPIAHQTSETDLKEEEEKVAKVIQSFYKKPISKNLDLIAKAVVEASDDKDLDYKLMIAIMKVESDFRQHVVSSTGDISVAQIRYETWSEDLWKVKKIKLDRNRLKKDPKYAIQMMSEVLDVLRQRHADKDPHWYARYHSRTLTLKVPYMKKLHAQIEHINKSELSITKEKVKEVLSSLEKVKALSSEEGLDYDLIVSLINDFKSIEKKLNNPKIEKSQLVAFR